MPTPPSSPWDDLYNDVRLAVPAVSDAVIEQEVYKVVKDFFDQTNIWQETVPIPVTPDVTVYPFTVANKGFPNRLLLLYDPSINSPDWKWVQSNVQMLVPGTITIGYPPSEATTWQAIVGKILMRPTDVNNFPDMEAADHWIISKYNETLVDGVIGRLLDLPAKAFSNPQAGAMFRQRYISGRSKARQDVNQTNLFGGQRWVFPQGWAALKRSGWA